MFARFFIDRPIFAAVLSIVITLAGALSVFNLPLAQYPQIAPPTVQVDCNYPGADAKVVAETIAAPIEQQVNGVEDMLYMSSQSTNDGSYTLTVTFKLGVNLDIAQVLVQNRINLALPQLPDVVKQTGITTKKRSPDILLVTSLNSPTGKFDQLYLSNYAFTRLRDELARLPGISECLVFGQRDYAMRIWLDPEKMSVREITATDVVNALRDQNLPVAAGQIGAPPVSSATAEQYVLTTPGRLSTPEEFEDIVVKRGPRNQVVRIKDIARVTLGSRSQDVSNRFNSKPTIGIAIFQLPDANALKTADLVKAKMAELAKDFPEGVQYDVGYDTTPFIRESIGEVFKALRDSVILVAVVVLIFLQSWRSAIIPLIAVPVAIIGTFAVMLACGFSLNNLTMFGLVLAIGIVVDDAIVVVEAVEHHIEHGLSPRSAAIKAMEEVSGPVIAVGLVLSAVFIPCAFIRGIVGQFFRQFALTIAISTLISAFNSLTLSPALAAILLRPKKEGRLDWGTIILFAVLGGITAPVLRHFYHIGHEWSELLYNLVWVPTGIAAALLLYFGFNPAFGLLTRSYTFAVGKLFRVVALVLLVYGGLLVLTYWGFQRLPTGFIPDQDKGYFLASVRMPDATAVGKTSLVMKKIEKIILGTKGIGHVNSVIGNSFLLSAYGSNFGSMFIILKPFDQRGDDPEQKAPEILKKLRAQLGEQVPEAEVAIFGPPPVSGLGRAGGFKYMIQDRGDVGLEQLQRQTENMVTKMRQLRLGSLPPPPDDADLRGEVKSIKALTNELPCTLRIEGVKENRRYDKAQVTLTSDTKFYTWTGGEKVEVEFEIINKDKKVEITFKGSKQSIKEGSRVQCVLTNPVPEAKPVQASASEVLIIPDDNRPAALQGAFTVFRTDAPKFYIDIDRKACLQQGIELSEVFQALQVFLGSRYVNDINLFGRTWQVVVQADVKFRDKLEGVQRLKVRNRRGQMVPLGSVSQVRDNTGPLVLTRYNMYPAAAINGSAAQRVSSGEAIDMIETLAEQELPMGMGAEWTEIFYLEKLSGGTGMLVFGFSVIFVFLVLAAQYESWTLPLAVILVVPLCVLSSLVGVWMAEHDINIFTQVGFVVLIGLACKNAILIVEFAKARREEGKSAREATLEACGLRLRPILMTSFAFILGVVPLVLAHGAGAEMRQVLGTAVFAGMLGVTLFGIFLTPVFFYVIDRVSQWRVFHSPTVIWINNVTMDVLTFRWLRRLILRTKKI